MKTAGGVAKAKNSEEEAATRLPMLAKVGKGLLHTDPEDVRKRAEGPARGAGLADEVQLLAEKL